jgi:hypothetical protein
MNRKTPRILTPRAAVTAFFLVSAGALDAQVNMTGTWALEVDIQGSITNPSLTLTQEGMAITGSYSSAELGETDAVTGTVDGNTVNVVIEVDLQGQAGAATYNGTVNAEGVWSGTFDLAGLASGTFTGTKQ